MTRIHFYHGARDRIQAAAEWLAQAFAIRRHALAFVPDQDMANRLDHLLWTRGATSFIPHCRADSRLAEETPILISSGIHSPVGQQHLLNLDHAVPAEFARFEEIIEIVSTDDGDRLPARDRYRFYRERGYELIDRKVSEGFILERS